MKFGRRQRQELLNLIRKHDDPILKTVCTLQVDEAPRSRLITLMKNVLEATQKGNGNGVGIAAPQLGFNDRVIVVHKVYTPWPKMPYAMIDPTFVPLSEDDTMQKEGCLSYPGITTQVIRFNKIMVRWTDEAEHPQGGVFTGFPARVVQHEVDHLNGKCEVGIEWEQWQ